MNWLDIILIIINIGLLIFGIVSIIMAIITRDDWSDWGLVATMFWILYIIIGGLFYGSIFIVLDKGSGATVGTITSIDKNFFGTTAIYVKTSETNQEKYCIENEDIADLAKTLIDKKVKISYGERIGLYSTGKCRQAPIDKIETID